MPVLLRLPLVCQTVNDRQPHGAGNPTFILYGTLPDLSEQMQSQLLMDHDQIVAADRGQISKPGSRRRQRGQRRQRQATRNAAVLLDTPIGQQPAGSSPAAASAASAVAHAGQRAAAAATFVTPGSSRSSSGGRRENSSSSSSSSGIVGSGSSPGGSIKEYIRLGNALDKQLCFWGSCSLAVLEAEGSAPFALAALTVSMRNMHRWVGGKTLGRTVVMITACAKVFGCHRCQCSQEPCRCLMLLGGGRFVGRGDV
jgi:hypothetical protein